MFSLPRHNACWNWVNIFGVAVEFFDQWSLPVSSEVVPSPSRWNFVRVLRPRRLVRLLKAIRAMLSVNTSWAEKEAFHSFMIVIIDWAPR